MPQCTCQQAPLIDLGFTQAPIPAGTHICQIYSDEAERDDSLMRFLLRGIQNGELNACFSENIDRNKLRDFLSSHGVDLDEAMKSGQLTLNGTRAVYFQDNRFDPDRMLGMLRQFHITSQTNGYTGARVIGEMSPEVRRIDGGSRLLEYESRVSLLLRTHPVTAVCQYDARVFDGATIMEVLKVHPMMIVRGVVVQNPFFIPPEEILRGSNLNA
jgi:hypothetical protein